MIGALVALVSSGYAAETAPNCDNCRCAVARSGPDCAADSGSFIVRSFVGGPAAADVVRHCEAARTHLRSAWFDDGVADRWQPKCRVVLHPTRQSYLSAVGAGGGQTVGSSTIALGGGRVTQRRIDLLGTSANHGLAALPHELVHVLFADAFPTTPPPKWAEEGLALLMDTPDKRARHARDLDAALRSRSTLPLARLLADANYPAPADRAAFYAQSLSLVALLTELDSPRTFVRFVKLATERDAESALMATYGISSRELERRWRNHASGVQLTSAESH